MRIVTLILCLAWLTPAWLSAQEIKVTPLLSKDLTGFPGKEGTLITVVYPPGGSETIHRHNAQVFVYVLQGSVVMQVRGGKEMILTAGQTFYESLTDIHVIGRNASKTEPARFIAFFLKDKGAPTHIPAN
jgi:quercetin dioxygenase-like cupin family protein